MTILKLYFTADEIWSGTERKNRFRIRDFGSDGNGRLRKFITEKSVSERNGNTVRNGFPSERR